MFFKRLSRTRGDSYVDEFDRSPQSRLEKYDARPSSSRQSQNGNNYGSLQDSKEIYSRSHAPQDVATYHPQRPQVITNGLSHKAMPLLDPVVTTPTKVEPTPDLLARAFNDALRPYTDKIEHLEGQVADLQAWVEQLEQQRAEVHSWIDKRGLRPDVPPAIARAMDATPEAASILNAQLDRKITIVNFDLHRLQDDLNDSISSAHFASAMSKFLPDIERLAALPTGPRFAFDLVLKLGGNLNSHGGLDNADAADADARRDFYTMLDAAMVDVVGRRFQEAEDWPVVREIKRIEKTGAYLKSYGVEPYFPKTLEAMKREVDFRSGAGTGSGSAQSPQHQTNGTPPRY